MAGKMSLGVTRIALHAEEQHEPSEHIERVRKSERKTDYTHRKAL